MAATPLTDFIQDWKTRLREPVADYWSPAELEETLKRVLQELSEYSPFEEVEIAKTTASSRTIDTSALTTLLAELVDGLHSIKKAEYKTVQNPRIYRNVKFIDDATIELDISSAPSTAGENINIWCDKIHVLNDSGPTNTLTARQRRVALDGCEAYAILQYATNMRVQIAAAITAIELSTTALLSIAARITQCVTDINSGRTEVAKVPATITAAVAEIAKISPEVLQAITDLDSGRAFINTLNVGNSPESMFAQYANTGLNDAIGYLRSAGGYFDQGKADESIASTYAGLGARELAAAASKISEAHGNLSEATARLSVARTIQAYEQSGNQKLALYRQELHRLETAPDGKRYLKD